MKKELYYIIVTIVSIAIIYAGYRYVEYHDTKSQSNSDNLNLNSNMCSYGDIKSIKVYKDTYIPLDIITWSDNVDALLQVDNVTIGRVSDYLYSNNVINNLAFGGKLSLATSGVVRGYMIHSNVENKIRISKLPHATLLDTIGCKYDTNTDSMGNYLI